MLRLAILSARGRLGTFTGALIALIASSALVMAGGMPFEAALRAHPPVERYAAAAAVVTGDQSVGSDNDIPLSERVRVSSALATRLADVPGVRAAIADVSVPARLGARATVAHGWSSHALQRTAVFLADGEAARLAGHPGWVDAIGVLAGPGFDASAVRAASRGAVTLTGDARGKAESPDLQDARTTLIAVTASFGGLALFIAIFVVASTMGLSIQQREREIALLRAVAATPRQIRRLIAWEAAIVGLIGSVIGLWPGALLGRALGEGLVEHGIAPPDLTVHAGWL